ncbi:sorting and assembly machinery component 50 homolog B [Onthophagus taurus]|uniref:sorting and assembly machinery component 50 homolog B n=1 Tax=Onthophagus taurus TaxID=166361 RepID=UPI0039BEB506
MGIVHAKDNSDLKMPQFGIPKAEINYDEIEESRSIPLDVPVRVDTISINGLSRTKDDIVEDATKDIFKSKNFREVLYNAHKARLKLETLSCFRNIAVHIDVSRGPKATPEGLDVTFQVKELKRVVGGVNTEVGNNEGSVVVGLRVPNAFGRGERVFVEYSYGSRKSNNFSVGAVKPLMGKYEPKISASVFQNVAEVAASGYKELERGFAVDFGLLSFANVRHNFQYKGSTRELGVLSKSSSFEVRENSGPTLKSALAHILTVDLRDDLIFPACGTLFQLNTEFAGIGGNIGFLKNDLYVQSNISVLKDVVIQGTLGGGFLKGIGNDMQIGMSDMFFLGGPLDLRGFQMRGIGPRADGDALGAEMYWSAGLHLFTPLPFRPGKGGFGDIFRTHFFVNAGNVATEKSEEKYVDQMSKNVRLSTGLGIAVRLGQMARVEINYCFPIKFSDGDQTQPGVQFGIGLQFS